MEIAKKFYFYDSVILLSPTGQRAGNLKEFLHILEESEEKVIFHHQYQTHMRSLQKMVKSLLAWPMTILIYAGQLFWLMLWLNLSQRRRHQPCPLLILAPVI